MITLRLDDIPTLSFPNRRFVFNPWNFKIGTKTKSAQVVNRVARFFLVHDTKTGKIFQMKTQNVPNGNKISQM
jgi:hypothetical protein